MKTILRKFRFLVWFPPVLMLMTATRAQAQLVFVTNNGAITITGYSGSSAGTLVVPGTTNGLPVTSVSGLGYYQFSRVILPDSITNIGNSAFSGAVLTNITLGNGILYFGNNAFSGCLGLTSFTIPNSVASMGFGAFSGCTHLTHVVIGSGLASISPNCFQGCTSLSSVTMLNGVASIGSESFESTGLMRINLPDTVTNIDGYAFDHNASLTNITIGSGVTTIGIQAFDNYLGSSNAITFYFKGNAPAIGANFAKYASVYYLPGTTGWGTTFGGFPAALWNPQAQTGDGLFGVRTNRFGFTITGTTNIPLVIEACADLSGNIWTPLQFLNLTNGSYYFSDSKLTTNNMPTRFYRIRSP